MGDNPFFLDWDTKHCMDCGECVAHVAYYHISILLPVIKIDYQTTPKYKKRINTYQSLLKLEYIPGLL
jgi:hypothetical protein